jgi:hypothetical protein
LQIGGFRDPIQRTRQEQLLKAALDFQRYATVGRALASSAAIATNALVTSIEGDTRRAPKKISKMHKFVH